MNNELFLREVKINTSKQNNSYPFNIPVIKKTEHIMFDNPVTFFIGENGSGKSTLLEAIAIESGLNPEGGSKNFLFETKNTHSELHKYLTLVRSGKRPKNAYFLRAESFYNLATNIDDLDENTGIMYESYGGESLHEKSHGEAFLSLIVNRFGGNGLYILDEPEAALSPMRQFALLKVIKDLVNQNSQFIIATHSPILMAFPNSTILSFGEKCLEEQQYEDTEHYAFTKYFLSNYDRCLRELFREEE